MGAYEDVTWYFWNWMIYLTGVGSITGCWWFGGWGLIFDDDNGQLMEECMTWFGGSKASFPYDYGA